MPLYDLTIKSHCEAPDFDIEFEAENREEALNKLEGSRALESFTKDELDNMLSEVIIKEELVSSVERSPLYLWLRQVLYQYDRGILSSDEVITRMRDKAIRYINPLKSGKKENAK